VENFRKIKFLVEYNYIVETIESLYAIATGNLTRGSISRVIDCCGQSAITYDCIKTLGGICTYDDYPAPRNTCVANACQPFASVSVEHI
jgi:hypothetical protein